MNLPRPAGWGDRRSVGPSAALGSVSSSRVTSANGFVRGDNDRPLRGRMVVAHPTTDRHLQPFVIGARVTRIAARSNLLCASLETWLAFKRGVV
jgi:hypothetical protein